MSGSDAHLSHLVTQLLAGPVQPDTGRVGADVQDHGDLACSQLLPGPQPQQFGVASGQRGECSTYLVGDLVISGTDCHLDRRIDNRDLGGDPLLATRATLGVGEAVAGYAVGPRQLLALGYVVETPPAHDQGVAEGVISRRRVGTTCEEAS